MEWRNIMFIIVGLGNPGDKYTGTRHNIGFDIITKLADEHDIKMDFMKHKALCGKGYIDGNKVILAQPLTYMNLSGESVIELINYYKIDQDELIIIYDDISLDVGKIRIRKKGSAGGHNGIKNIIQHLGTQEFNRIKIGVGEKPKQWDLAEYVLSAFAKEDEGAIKDAISNAACACRDIINNDVEYAMNKYNVSK